MIIRQQPTDVENYLVVDKTASYNLISNGFEPLYMWRNYYYYKKQRFDLNYIKAFR